MFLRVVVLDYPPRAQAELDPVGHEAFRPSARSTSHVSGRKSEVVLSPIQILTRSTRILGHR